VVKKCNQFFQTLAGKPPCGAPLATKNRAKLGEKIVISSFVIFIRRSLDEGGASFLSTIILTLAKRHFVIRHFYPP
jgi:hypothetical protein